VWFFHTGTSWVFHTQ